MSYIQRFIPNSNPKRLEVLTKAKEKKDRLPPAQNILSAGTTTRLDIIQPQFATALTSVSSLSAMSISKTAKKNASGFSLRQYCSHYLQVFNFAVERGIYPKAARAVFNLNTETDTLPSMVTDAEVEQVAKDIAPSDGPITRSKFKNLRHGVNIMTAVLPYSTTVFHAKFENCLRGIRNEGVNLCTFVGNDFTMGATAAEYTDYFTDFWLLDEGIIQHHSTGFVTEQNTFADTASPFHQNLGIRSDETGAADNRICNNTFTGVNAGNVANRQNQFSDGINPPTGLRYDCNQNTGNTHYDFAVATNSNEGIRNTQGSLSLSAGNTFSHNNVNVAESDFYNSGVGLKYYYYGTNDPQTNPQFPFSVSSSVFADNPVGIQDNSCVTNYTLPTDQNPNGGGCVYCPTYEDYSTHFSTHKSAYNAYNLLYLALIDGGNTQARILMVDTITDGSRLKDSLLAYAPNLSAVVLDAAARKNTLLGDTAQYLALKANAEGITYEILDYLATRTEMPEWMLDSISIARNNLTLRSYLLDTLIYHSEQKQQAVYGILRLIQEDTAGFNITIYRNWLDSADGTWAKRQMTNTYFLEGKLDTIETLIAHYDTLIPAYDSASFKNYKDFALSYKNWLDTDTFIMRLDSAHKAELVSIAGIDEHKAGSNAARNILNFFYDSAYFTPAYLPEVQYGKRENDEVTTPLVKQQEQTLKEQPSIKLYPNPAQNVVTIEYAGLVEGDKLYVSNAIGILQEMKILSNSKGKVVINTSSYTNGIYLARIETEGDSSLKSKFIILR